MIHNILARDPASRTSESNLNAGASGRSTAPSSPPPTSAPAPTAPNSNASAPEISISAEGQAMQKLADGLRQKPLNEQKVAALRQAIAENTYRIDPQQVARKMLQFEQHQS